MTGLLSLEHVSLRAGATTIVSDVSLDVPSGQVLALLGPSGCGKTSVLRLLLGFAAPTTGEVKILGERVSAAGHILVPPESRDLAVVFQDLALWPHMTVFGNLSFGLEAKKVPRALRESRIADMLHRVGLAGKERRYPGELSGGERQRVAIARALVLEPRAVLMDEPLSSLDVGLKREMLSMFKELLTERGLTATYVTHDPREAATLGDRVAVMDAGRLVQTGTMAELAKQPANLFVERLIDDLRWTGGQFD
jgi:iron(III) transport system ATP-binding protein